MGILREFITNCINLGFDILTNSQIIAYEIGKYSIDNVGWCSEMEGKNNGN